MDEHKLIKYDDKQLQKVGNAIAVTNKLLALVEPQLIPYRKGNKWGYCTADKKIVIDCVYDIAEPFDGELGIVGLRKHGYGCVDKKGHLVIPCLYCQRLYFREDLAIIQLPDTDKISKINSQRIGFVNRKGIIVIPMQYDWCSNVFSEGFAAVSLNGRWGYIDKGGAITIACKYEYAKSYSEDLAAVKLNRKWGFIDKTGKEIIPCIYEHCENFTQGLAAVFFEDLDCKSKWGMIDKSGKTIVPFRFQEEPPTFSEGIAVMHVGPKKSVYVNTNLSLVFPQYYEGCDNFSEGLASIMLEAKWGYIDKTGTIVIPCKYEKCKPFSEKFAAVCINKKWGFIDNAGQIIIPCFYDECSSFSENIATVLKDGLWGCIDKTGQLISACKYTGDFSFKNGLAPIYSKNYGGRLGFINREGIEFWED